MPGRTATVAVVADPSIADSVSSFAQKYNDEATGRRQMPGSDGHAERPEPVLRGLTGTWPAELGAQPALWLPASSAQSARLQSAIGEQAVSDARSLVTSRWSWRCARR